MFGVTRAKASRVCWKGCDLSYISGYVMTREPDIYMQRGRTSRLRSMTNDDPWTIVYLTWLLLCTVRRTTCPGAASHLLQVTRAIATSHEAAGVLLGISAVPMLSRLRLTTAPRPLRPRLHFGSPRGDLHDVKRLTTRLDEADVKVKTKWELPRLCIIGRPRASDSSRDLALLYLSLAVLSLRGSVTHSLLPD